MHQVSFLIGVAAARLNLSNGQLLGLARECAQDHGIVTLADLQAAEAAELLHFLQTATAEEIINKLARRRMDECVDRRAELIGV